MQPRRPTAAFTLLEICLAVAIGLMVVLIAVPSVQGVFAEQRLHKTFDAFDELARKAQARSIDEQRTYVILWKKESIEMAPYDLRSGEKAPDVVTLPVQKGEDYRLERTAALTKNPPLVWTFWKSGVCEPATVGYKGPNGSWLAQYDPLTGHGKLLEESVK